MIIWNAREKKHYASYLFSLILTFSLFVSSHCEINVLIFLFVPWRAKYLNGHNPRSMRSYSRFYPSLSYQPKNCRSGNTESNFYVYRTLCITSYIAQHWIHAIYSDTPLQTQQVYCFSPIFGKPVRSWNSVSDILKVLEVVFQNVPHEAFVSAPWEY